MSDNAVKNQDTADETTDNLSQADAAINESLSHDEKAAENELAQEEKTDLENETIEKLKLELQEAKDKYLRLAAEFDNFRRRNAKERLELIQTAGKDIIQSLLVVLDDSDRALKQLEKATEIAEVKEGISLVLNKLQATLQQKGLAKMESSNLEFNPDLHEAITEIPAPNEDMIGKVMDVVEPGYYLNDKLIRHAKVVVGK